MYYTKSACEHQNIHKLFKSLPILVIVMDMIIKNFISLADTSIFVSTNRNI